jgi:hypothetical protein
MRRMTASGRSDFVPIRDIVKQIELLSFALILTLPYDGAMKRLRHKQCSIHLGFLDSVTAETGLAVGQHTDQAVNNIGQPFTVPIDCELRTQRRRGKPCLVKARVEACIGAAPIAYASASRGTKSIDFVLEFARNR